MTLRDQLARNLDGLRQHNNILGLYISDLADRMQCSESNTVVLKAATADPKAYRDAVRCRQIPVGVMNQGGLIWRPLRLTSTPLL